MNTIKQILSFIITLCVVVTAAAQDNAKRQLLYGQLPLRLSLAMSGDFAEIRPNHFHSGLDIRTDGEEGKPIFSPADGYVSRINISPWGGGKVLYIAHPDGHTTVYMHLSTFCGRIGEFVHNYQYDHHVYAFDTKLPVDSIKVRKGDLVALTGNTGGSMGPHLHYEIRLTENDQTINPLHFALPYSDPIAPTIAGIKLYPATINTTIEGRNKELKIYPSASSSKKKGSSGSALSSRNRTILVSGRFYTGIYTYDQMEYGSRSKNGVERIELYVDDTLFHTYSVPSFIFEETRAINALIDYGEYQRSREYYILSRRLHGDPTNFNSVKRDFGYLQFDDDNTHKLQYRVSDYKGNSTSHTFYVRDTGTVNKPAAHEPDIQELEHTGIQTPGDPIAYYKPFHFVRDGFTLDVDANNIYGNDYIVYSCTADPGGITQQHSVSLRRNPLPPHDRIKVALAIPDKVPTSLHSKLVVVCINGKKATACPSKVEGGHISATSRSWGSFALRFDSEPPTIRPSGFSNNGVIRDSKVSVIIGDNLSGVEHYSCTVNGEWQVVEYDGKSRSLILSARLLRKGKNTLQYTLTDAVGNTTSEEYTVYKN